MVKRDSCRTDQPLIGSLNEGSLHAAIKAWCAGPGDLMEVEVDGYVIDVRQGDLLIEVQTGSFSTIAPKLKALCAEHSVRLVYPLVRLKTLVKLDPKDRAVIGRRRSPKRGRWLDLFDELVYIPTLIEHPRFELLVVQIAIEEMRCADGRGSWRQKGVSVIDRQLDEVLETRLFRSGKDLMTLLPESLPLPFTHRQLAHEARIRLNTAQRVSYCLRKLGLLEVVGRRHRAMVLAPTHNF